VSTIMVLIKFHWNSGLQRGRNRHARGRFYALWGAFVICEI